MVAARKSFGFNDSRAHTTLQSLAVFLFWLCLAVTGAAAVVCLRLVAADFRLMQTVLLASVAAFAGAVFLHACLTFSACSAVVLATLTCAVALLVETAGQRWGIPFGARYTYHLHFVPTTVGGVPLFVLLAWFVLAYGPLVVFRSLVQTWNLTAWSRRLAKALACAAALTAFDLFLDPLAVTVGAWRWDGGGAYFGVPLTNYAGWLATGLLIYVPFVALDLDRKPSNPSARDVTEGLDRSLMLAGLVLQTVALAGTAAVTGSLIPVVVTLAAMGPYLGYVRSVFRRRPPALTIQTLGN